MSFVNKLVNMIFLYTLLLATAEFNADFFFLLMGFLFVVWLEFCQLQLVVH